VSGARRPRGAEQLKAAQGARLEVSGARRPRVAEQPEAAKGARLEVSGARRAEGAEQLAAAEGGRLEVVSRAKGLAPFPSLEMLVTLATKGRRRIPSLEMPMRSGESRKMHLLFRVAKDASSLSRRIPSQ